MELEHSPAGEAVDEALRQPASLEAEPRDAAESPDHQSLAAEVEDNADGKPSPTRARQSGYESLPTKASTQSVSRLSNAGLNADFSSAAQQMKVSNRIPDSMACPDKKAF